MTTSPSSPSPRTWWPQHLLLGWMNLVLTAPFLYLFVGLSLVMRQHGFSGTQMGVMLLAGLPAMLKFALAAPIDRWHLGRSNYRNWAVVLSLAYAGALALVALNPLETTPYLRMFSLIMLASLAATWADVPVNALAIALLPETERIRAGAVRSAATSLGAIAGGGLMLVLHARHGWAAPLYTLALGVVSCAVLIPWLKTPSHMPVRSAPPVDVSFKQWLGWFAQPEHRFWTVLLLLYYPLIGTSWFYLKPLMLDHGFEPERVAVIVGMIGGLIAAAASMIGSRISRRIGPRKALPLFVLGDLLALGALTGVVLLGLGPNALIVAVVLIALAVGASAGLVYGLTMYYARPGLAALDYGIQTSLFVAGRTFIPMFAGMILDWGGYSGMLGSLMLAIALLLLLVWVAVPRVFTPTTTEKI